MNFLLNIILILLGISIANAESSEVKDVISLIGKLSRENHLSHPPCHCETKGLSKSKFASKVEPMSEEERKQRLNEAIERLKPFLALLGYVNNFFTQKTNGLIKIMGKAVESELEDEDYDMPRRVYRRSMRKYWPPYVNMNNEPQPITPITISA